MSDPTHPRGPAPPAAATATRPPSALTRRHLLQHAAVLGTSVVAHATSATAAPLPSHGPTSASADRDAARVLPETVTPWLVAPMLVRGGG